MIGFTYLILLRLNSPRSLEITESVSESMVHRRQKDQANLLCGELKMPAKQKTMGCHVPKYPELNQTLLDWFQVQVSLPPLF